MGKSNHGNEIDKLKREINEILSHQSVMLEIAGRGSSARIHLGPELFYLDSSFEEEF